jgi:hypothetical protein
MMLILAPHIIPPQKCKSSGNSNQVGSMVARSHNLCSLYLQTLLNKHDQALVANRLLPTVSLLHWVTVGHYLAASNESDIVLDLSEKFV